jgi:hypothetical protein
MRRVDEQIITERHQPIGHALVILPAICLGVLAMLCASVSPMLWGQQIAAWMIFTLLAWLLRRAIKRVSASTLSVILWILLAASLLGEEVGGARRWLDLGIFNINTAMLVLPVLLVMLFSTKCPYPVLLGTAVVLCVQPDLSQLMAFSIAVLPLLMHRRKERFWTAACFAAMAALAIRCLLAPVSVAPVEYCEGIFAMLGEVSPFLLFVGVIALAVIPVVFAYHFFRHGRLYLLALAAYYAITLLFGLSGEYPVPFMGFGLSPIAGYFLAVALI